MIFKKVTKVRESGGGAMASHTEFLREKALKNKRLCLSQEEGKNISNRDERQRRWWLLLGLEANLSSIPSPVLIEPF